MRLGSGHLPRGEEGVVSLNSLPTHAFHSASSLYFVTTTAPLHCGIGPSIP